MEIPLAYDLEKLTFHKAHKMYFRCNHKHLSYNLSESGSYKYYYNDRIRTHIIFSLNLTYMVYYVL